MLLVYLYTADHDSVLLLFSRCERIGIPYGRTVCFFGTLSNCPERRISAVKFIRDQANAALSGHNIEGEEESIKDRGPQNAAQMAASALRKVLRGDNSTKLPIDIIQETGAGISGIIEPLSGWSDGVSLQRSHCCILLKPQIIFSAEAPEDKCIVAAAQAKLESFAIMDISNLEDPVSGKIMSRCVKIIKNT